MSSKGLHILLQHTCPAATTNPLLFHLPPPPEFIRHFRARPCTTPYWLMLGVMSGLVTVALMAVAACFVRRRLWRGPRWVAGWVEAQHERALAPAGAGLAALSAADLEGGDSCDRSVHSRGPTPVTQTTQQRLVAALAKIGSKRQRQQLKDQLHEPQPSFFVRLRSWWLMHSPFSRGPPSQVITCNNACISDDGFARWRMWRVIGIEVAALPLAVAG